MGIYKVIKIKLPKILQGNKKKAIATFFLKKRTKNSKNVTKRKQKINKKRNNYFFQKNNISTKKHKKKIKHNKMKLKHIVIVLFFALILIKGVTILHHHNEQKQIQNTEAITETKRNFFVKESLPY